MNLKQLRARLAQIKDETCWEDVDEAACWYRSKAVMDVIREAWPTEAPNKGPWRTLVWLDDEMDDVGLAEISMTPGGSICSRIIGAKVPDGIYCLMTPFAGTIASKIEDCLRKWRVR